ncbi:MAG: isoprenylcysteine carboxylmethyltransferase family protein [Dehalococcoidia bacterium]
MSTEVARAASKECLESRLATQLARVPPLPFVLGVLAARGIVGRPLRLPGARVVGALCLFVGVGLDAWSIRTQLRAGTSPLPDGRHTRLVTWGPYAYSRNPIYVAHTLVALGVGLLWTRSAWAVLGAALGWYVSDRVTVPLEEAALAEQFGAEFESYRGRVGRWWGSPGWGSPGWGSPGSGATK